MKAQLSSVAVAVMSCGMGSLSELSEQSFQSFCVLPKSDPSGHSESLLYS